MVSSKIGLFDFLHFGLLIYFLNLCLWLLGFAGESKFLLGDSCISLLLKQIIEVAQSLLVLGEHYCWDGVLVIGDVLPETDEVVMDSVKVFCHFVRGFA